MQTEQSPTLLNCKLIMLDVFSQSDFKDHSCFPEIVPSIIKQGSHRFQLLSGLFTTTAVQIPVRTKTDEEVIELITINGFANKSRLLY